ncbi:MAG: MotA/TolQ/ExbB proton channel family protein [Sphingomonas sp.]|nr:MotA/TolQ/ExbB proton channel family protein [Sphingomonas sp.]
MAVLDQFFDPLAVLIVIGGTVVGTLLSTTRGDIGRAFGAFGPLLRADPVADGEAARRAVRQIERISEYKGIFCADRVKSPGDFVHRAACRLADSSGALAFAAWANEEMEERRARHAAAIGVWRHAAELAPSMGMIGTVIGLTAMFAKMSDPSAMGPAMAIAMLTTLYGLLVAACVAGPIATRLERLSRAECQWQQRVVDRLIEVARVEETNAMALWRERKGRQAG